ncbi:MAG: SDR family NAD(P)-dependent oxidoreductase [Rhodospirillales bacterium]|jgi:3-oxoacyl-[acyl-carrier protein] reductase
MGELTGKVALVTGGSKGIGRATVELLAREGATIAMLARSKEPLAAAAQEIAGKYQVNVITETADILDPNSIKKYFEFLSKQIDQIDILVNNAGGSEQRVSKESVRMVATVDAPGDPELPPSRFADMNEEEFQNAFNQKFFGMLRVTREAMPLIRKSGDASIVNIVSVKGNQSPPRVLTSGIAWSACLNWSKSLSFELGPEGIRVNVVSVGGIVTPNLEGVHERFNEGETFEEFFKHRTKNVALRRLGQADEVADAIYFLASPRSSYITGQYLALDGGSVRCM